MTYTYQFVLFFQYRNFSSYNITFVEHLTRSVTTKHELMNTLHKLSLLHYLLHQICENIRKIKNIMQETFSIKNFHNVTYRYFLGHIRDIKDINSEPQKVKNL